MSRETTNDQAKPQAIQVHGSQLRYTVARIKTAGYEILDVQRHGNNYVIVVAMPADAQLPKRTNTTRKRRQSSIGRTLRGIGSGMIVIAIGIIVIAIGIGAMGPAAAMFGTGVGAGLVAAAGGVLTSSILILPAALIVLLILALTPAAMRLLVKAQDTYRRQ